MAALFEMPLSELKQYKGINPCPADFEEYWERSLKEMNALDPQVELVPAEFRFLLLNVLTFISQV